jgi:diguanylate cyclase (GGDEF)-like protein
VDIDGARYGCEEAAISCRFGRQTRHSCAYRLTVEGRELGEVIFLRGRSFSESEMQDIEHLLVALVYPLRNALAHRSALLSARRDALTGLGNRASLDEQLDRELQFATRHTQPLSVALLDIDHFKAINDLNGHAAGDHVLRALAETLRGCVRDSDLAFRYGGEEFAVILSNTGLEGAAQVAERIRGAIAEADFRLPDGTRLSVTGSLGVAEHQLGETREGLMERADQALYRAKAEGRNRTAA